MRKRVFDETMSEHIGALVFIPKVDAVAFDRRAEAAGGRREDREVTSPVCHIGTSEACCMACAHACRSAGAAAGSASGCMCMLHAPHEAASTMARCGDARGRGFALVFVCLCERAPDGSEGSCEGVCGGDAGGHWRRIWRVPRGWPSHLDCGRGWESSGPWLRLHGALQEVIWLILNRGI